jgi:hypothetical protein
MPARARQSQNVPVSYPRRIKISPSRATKHGQFAGIFFKSSDGLEPSTSSLPFWGRGNQRQSTATDFAWFRRFGVQTICHWLPLVAPAGLHKRSILGACEAAAR